MLHANGRNIVGCYMLHLFAHPVACCFVFLWAVAQYFETGQTFSYVQMDKTMLRQFARGFREKTTRSLS